MGRGILLGALIAASFVNLAIAQPRGPRVPMDKQPRPLETRISVELITGPEGNGFRAQSWARFFESLEIPFKIHRGIQEDGPDLKEKMVGTSLREITVIGIVAKDGALEFTGHRFQEHDRDALKVWLRELKTYGSQGEPTGKPFWGLTDTQFKDLHKQLSAPVLKEFKDITPAQYQVMLQLPPSYPLVFEAVNRRQWEERGATTLAPKGFSKGCLLARGLREAGLGFYPRRTPTGEIELAVVDLAEQSVVWPVGWAPTDGEYKLAPSLFDPVTLEEAELPLGEFLVQVREVAKIPLFVDLYALQRDGIKPDTATVKIPGKRTVYNMAVQAALFKLKLRGDLLVDEAGHPFVWVTSETAKRETRLPAKAK